MKQLSFLPKITPNIPREFGGRTRLGKRKVARPFSNRLPIHVVLRALQAKGDHSLLSPKHRKLIAERLERYARLYQIKIYRFQNVGNHLHLLVQVKNKNSRIARTDFANFLRRFSGEIAMKITRAKKGLPFGRFWDELVYSRLISWGREFKVLKDYFVKNLFEAHGLWNRKRNSEWSLITIAPDTS